MKSLVARVCRRSHSSCAALIVVSAVAAMSSQAAWAVDAVRVTLDQAKVMRIPERTTTVVVGNPLIADISVQTGGVIVVTGKGYGATNLIAMDQRGNVLLELSVEVQGPSELLVTVHRGVDRESYSCTPNCERRITLGDTPAYFDANLQQTGRRDGQAQGTSVGNEPRGR